MRGGGKGWRGNVNVCVYMYRCNMNTCVYMYRCNMNMCVHMYIYTCVDMYISLGRLQGNVVAVGGDGGALVCWCVVCMYVCVLGVMAARSFAGVFPCFYPCVCPCVCQCV